MTSAVATPATGGCACGAVRYRVEAPLRPVVACHCRTCRRLSGHHVAATAAPRDAVKVTGAVRWYSASPAARRGFCPVCGAQLFWDGPRATLSIFAGSLDATSGLRLVGHIFCAEKGAYYTLDDCLPQAAGSDPALTAAFDA